MFKSLSKLKSLGEKSASIYNAGKDSFNQISNAGTIDEAKKYINEAVLNVFESIKSETKDYVSDDDKLIKSADLAYKALPPPVKIFLRKKRFRKIVLNVRDKCKDNYGLVNECSMEVIDNNLSKENME